jgi:ribosomal protein S18 acetylase RimI-like enzyme
MQIDTRPATDADTDFALATHHAAYREVVELQFGSWDEQSQDLFFAADWQPDSVEIICVEGARCGYWQVEVRDLDIHVRELVVHPTCQGRGIATNLLMGLRAAALERGKPIRLGTFHRNRAVNLYRRLGFREIGSTDTHVLMEWAPGTER